MKNLLLITLIAFATTGFISCTKTTDRPYISAGPIEQSRTVASSWFSLTFTEMADEFGRTYLQGDIRLDGVADVELSNHIDILYAQMEEAGQTAYRRIPLVNIADNFTVTYSLNNGTLSIRIDNNDGLQNLDATKFLDWKFRLIMVSTTDYQSIQADWDDYSSVENALASLSIN